MASIKMMQGDSYVVPIDLTLNGQKLTPDIADDVEICIGEVMRMTFSGGTVGYDLATERWYIRPTQAETIALEPDTYNAVARIKIGDDVKGINIGRLTITETEGEGVI